MSKVIERLITMDMIFYGANPNIHLYDKERRRIASFKQRPESAAPPPPGKARFDFRHTEPRQLAALCKQEPKQKWSFALKRHFYALSGSLYKELLFRSGVHPDTHLEAISSHQIGALSALFKQVAAECNSGQAFLYYQNEAILAASLVELTHLNAEPELRVERFDSINKAWWKFISLAQDKTKTDHLRALCRNAIQKRQRYLERSLQKMTEAADLRARKELAELKGNLLLTFQHEIEAGASAVTLKNIFSEQAETIQIKLNPAKSVVENATRYFTKYKQMDKQKEVAAIKQSNNAPCPFSKGLVVSNHDYGDPGFAIVFFKQLHDLLTHIAVQISGRFICQQQSRCADDGSCDGHTLLLSTRKLGGEMMHACRKANPGQGDFSHLTAHSTG